MPDPDPSQPPPLPGEPGAPPPLALAYAPPTYPSRPDLIAVPENLARVTIAFLALAAASSALGVWSGLSIIAFFGRLEAGEAPAPGEADGLDLLAGINALGGIAISIVIIVVFLCWMHATVRNAHHVGMIRPRPAWAVGSFFVPFVQLAVPPAALHEAARRLARAAGRPPRPFETWPVWLWWGAWLFANLAANIGLRLAFRDAFADAEPSLDALRQRAWLDVAGDATLIPAAAAAAAMILFLTRLQREARAAPCDA